MSKLINVVLYDSDREYIDSFSEYIKGQDRKGIIFNLFTDISSLLNYCKTEVADLIIVAEYLIFESSTNDITKKYSDKIIILGDEKEITHIDDYFCIYRFQKVDDLISNIFDICAERLMDLGNNVKYSRKVKTRRIGFFSPVGRCGKTKLTIEVGKRLACEGKRVLLMNFEEFSPFDKYLGKVCDSNISDLLFYYLSGSGCFEIKSEAIIKNYQGMDYISPVRCVEDLRNIEFDVWDSFIRCLAESRGYEVIIMDVTNMVKDYFRLLESADMFFAPYLDDEISRYKMDMFREYINISDYKSLNDKISEVRMINNDETDDNVTDIVMDKYKKIINCETVREIY